MFIVEGFILCFIYFVYYKYFIHHGAIHALFLYNDDVKKRVIDQNQTTFQAMMQNQSKHQMITNLIYIVYCIICVLLHHQKDAFLQIIIIYGMYQIFYIFYICMYCTNHNPSWYIPGTDDLQPYIETSTIIKKIIIACISAPIIAFALSNIIASIF